jgi:pyruvate-formate lyase-activating enzyme
MQIIIDNLPELDIYLYSTFDKFYSKHCKLRLNTVKENITRVKDKKLRILCPLIEDENDSDSSIRNIAKFILPLGSNIPLRFIKFIPDFRVVDKPITSDSRLDDAIRIAKECGLNNVEILIDNLG